MHTVWFSDFFSEVSDLWYLVYANLEMETKHVIPLIIWKIQSYGRSNQSQSEVKSSIDTYKVKSYTRF